MTQYITKLPAVFQTTTEKKFFDATFDQVFSKKDSDYLAGFIGRRNPGRYNPISDFYLPEPSKDRTWWQLEATAYARNPDASKTNIFFYDDLLDRINFYGGNTLNQDRLFESEYYSFGPPIDYDMFINYHNYYWIEQGLPNITITGVLASDIIGKSSYTTPATATPPNLTLTSGMSIILADDPLYQKPHTIENLGGCNEEFTLSGYPLGGIILVQKFPDFTSGTLFEFLPWDGAIELSNGRVIHNEYWDMLTWETQTQPQLISGDYITIERGAIDRNAWSRTNRWFHISAINATLAVTGTSFPQGATRALRPIIQFIANIPLYKSGTQFRENVQYGFRNNDNNTPILLVDWQNQPLQTINSTFNISMRNGDLVVFMNDSTEFADDITQVNHYIYRAVFQPNGDVNFTPYTSWETPVLEGDIILPTEDAPFDGSQAGSSWYYSLGEWHLAFNDKVKLNQPPLFLLYDHNGIPLDDPITYQGSSFFGSKIFSYKVNTFPGATVDPVLKFPIVYQSLGQASDIVFQNDLITNRYVYSAAQLDIDGYYYYKTYTSPVLYNNWNLYNPCDCAKKETDTNYQRLVSNTNQTVFNTSVQTRPNGDGKSYLQVFVNGVYQLEGASKNYIVSSNNQITFNTGLNLGDDVVIVGHDATTEIPNYEAFVSIAAQTVFNTSLPTEPINSNKAYLQIYVNGVYQMEGINGNYQVTGNNQVRFNTGLSSNDDVVIYGFSEFVEPPNYYSTLSTANQSVFNITDPVIGNFGTLLNLQVYVNGVYQIGGSGGNYQITGSNQITFSTALATNDNVIIFSSKVEELDACLKASKQRVIDKYVVGYGTEYQFKISVTPYGYTIGAGPIQPLADIIVSVNGVEVKSIADQIGGYVFEEINNRIYVNLTNYISTLLLTTQPQPPVVELQTYTHGLLSPSEPGYFEIPQQLEANPTNLEVGELTGSELTQQFASIISNQEGFKGSPFGGINNYRDTKKNRSLGEYILQNVAPILKSMLVSSSNDLDFIIAERLSNDQYTKFKSKYLITALQLINQEFNPLRYYTNSINISAWVSEILKILNISKDFSNAFAYSYMIASGVPTFSETHTLVSSSITLTNYIDLNDPRNVMYVYNVTDTSVPKILVVGKDYNVISTNLAIDVEVDASLIGVPLTFYLYRDPVPTYIPSTPTKLGLYSAYVPRIEIDYSYVNPAEVLIGHDGSKTILYGDYRDALLLELETRIYNGLQEKYRNQYYVPLRIEYVKSGFFRKARYSREEYLDITESYLNKWSAKYSANYRINEWNSQYQDTPNSEKWKLYNYRQAVNSLGEPLNLPGNWKGIFQYYYDTYYPDTQPWNMLGFSDKPSWWEYEYGLPVINGNGQEAWTNSAVGNNNMWNDIRDGIIRQGPSAIYDPVTLVAQPQAMWARPTIIDNLIPVDSNGNIISVMTLFDIAYSGNVDAPFDHFDEDWIYGDGSPVEQAWMSTSAYRFNIQEFLYLMRPGPYGELMWDTIGTELSPGMITVPTSAEPVMSDRNWQYIQNDSYTAADQFFNWMRPKNKNQIVHAEVVDGVTEIRFGYQRWISDRIMFLGKNVGDTFGQKIRTLDVNLANKLAGFTNKDTTNTYIESVTPGVATSSLIIPSTNFDVFLHKSPPINTYAYSGVVIRALDDGTFVVYGYDLLKSEFTIIDRSTDVSIDVTIGGTPVEFQYFTPGATYNQGDIVRYNGVYYESNGTQLVQRFEQSNWTKLKALPVTGGISVSYKPVSLETITRIPYGSILRNAQEVFDMLIGWGAYLEKEGWQFTDVNQDTNQISDWLYSAKQFLFWLNTNWAPDASIQVSPLANSATLIVKRGYPNDVEALSNGVYSILDKSGVAISPNNTTTDRDGSKITVAPVDLATGGIYFLLVTTSETEHVLIFDNTTNFNDIVYSPLLRARQQRLRFNGFRSNLWYGKMEAPGYLIIEDQLVPNYDTIVDDMRYYYDANVTIDNPSLEDLGKALIGYESKSYLDNLQVSNDVQYLFYKGAIRQKGTQQAFDKLFRSTKIQSNETIIVYEEWALKLGDFGNTVEQVSTEFILRPEQNTGQVIVARLNYKPSIIGEVKLINILNAENVYTTVPRILIAPPDADPLDINATEPLRQAKAFAILGIDGRIARIDVTDGGYGYLSAPVIDIDSGAESHALDSLYSVWQGVIIKDTELDNIIEIDIDQTDMWTVRPPDPEYSLEFPVTNNINYPIPNAGYVNFNDVDWSSFDVTQTVIRWGTLGLNPLEAETIWVAKTFTEDWDVYKLFDVTAISDFSVISNAGALQLTTNSSYPIAPQFSTSGNVTDFGNMIVLQIIEAQATATINLGAITEIIITKTGANYDVPPTAIIKTNLGNFFTTTTIAGGEVTSVVIPTIIGDVTTATVEIAPPAILNGDQNYTIGFVFNEVDTANGPGLNYYDLVTLDGTPVTDTDISNYNNFTKLMLFKTMRFLNMNKLPPVGSLPPYISKKDTVWVDQYIIQPLPLPPLWGVLKYTPPITVVKPIPFTAFRVQEPLINSSLFQSASVFSARTRNQVVQLPIYDPFKNILVGPAKQNITYMLMRDPARYNVTGDERLYTDNIKFGERQIGQLWWDLSTTRFVYYEQPIALDGSETSLDNLVYRRNRWAQIFPGSTVDVYEWVKSPVPPAEYTGTGIPRDITTYIQITTTNVFTNITETNFYFWVLGATDKPNIENRTLAALDVARLIQTPRSQGFSFFAPIQQTETNNSYMFYNVQEILAYQGDNVQIQYRLAEREDQKHTQWKLVREGDPKSLVTDQFWNKMVDSLCGYTKVLPLSDEFDNSIIVPGGEILVVPDPSLSEAEKYGISYRPRQGMFVNLTAARKVFVQAGNELLSHIPIRDDNPTWEANVSTSIYWEYTNWYKIGFENVLPSVIYPTLAAANVALLAGQLAIGTIIEVLDGTIDGRYVLYNVVQPDPNILILNLEEVGIQNSAIKLLDTIYTTFNLYNLAVELRELLDAFRTQVMVDEFIVAQNELYFSMLNYVLSEQKSPDWIFKTSYIYIKESGIPLMQHQLYSGDQINNVIDYIIDIKPYHTKIRDYTSAYTAFDLAYGTASDSYLWKLILQFGPNFADSIYPVENNGIDANPEGWDFRQGEITNPNYVAEPWDTIKWDHPANFEYTVNQYISRNAVVPNYNPGPGNPWPGFDENTIQVPLTFFDVSKIGYSQLFPYTFDFNDINIDNPQSFITPNNVVSIKVDDTMLYYGIDYYVGYNTASNNYTVYFYNDPGASTIVAFVWFDGGALPLFTNYARNSETANVEIEPNMVVNVDTVLPVNNVNGEITPLALWGDVWDSIDPNTTIGQALINSGVTTSPNPDPPFQQLIKLKWDSPVNLIILPGSGNTISFKANVNPVNRQDFYRNAKKYSGELAITLSAPDADNYNIQSIVITATEDVLPEPTSGNPGVIWIDGERIEYNEKQFYSVDTWELKLIRRGSKGTGITDHIAGALVFVEQYNIIPGNSATDVWNASSLPAAADPTTNQGPGIYTSIVSVPAGGLWYANTPEAQFLVSAPGKSIP